MNKTNLLLVLIVTSMFLFSCKKSSSDPVNPNNPNGPTIPSDAKGALYAIRTVAVANFGSGYDTVARMSTATAWFETYTPASKDAGHVLVNGDTIKMKDDFFGINTPWYTNSTFSNFSLFSKKDVQWKVTGNTANGIPAFTYTDVNDYGKVNSFTAPGSVSYSSGQIAVSFNIPNLGANDVLLFGVFGNKGKIARMISNTTTSQVVTNSELRSVSLGSGDDVSVQIMPVKMHSMTFQGKKYYFVKQYALSKTVEVL